MYSPEKIQQLREKGFSIPQIGTLSNHVDAAGVLKYAESMAPADIVELFSSATMKTGTAKKGQAKGQLPGMLPNGSPRLELSAGVLGSMVNFGGLESVELIDWKERLVLVNKGTGAKSNGMFLVLNKSKGLDWTETLAQLKTAENCFLEHLAAIEAVRQVAEAESKKQ